jgi:aminopeptidase N
MIADIQAGRAPHPDPLYLDAIAGVLERAGEDPAFAAQMLLPPSESELALAMTTIDPDAIHRARRALIVAAAGKYRAGFEALYARYRADGPFSPDTVSAGHRAVRNAALRFITADDDADAARLARAHYDAATNMTDLIAGLAALSRMGGPPYEAALAHFYDRFRNDPLVLDKWMGVQAMSPLPDTEQRVRALMRHPSFSLKNPNRVRALVGAFAGGNPLRFHDPSGSGYCLLREVVQTLDVINPQTAARMLTPFETWRRYDAARQNLIKAELETIAAQKPLSPNLYEIARKILGTAAD